MSEYPGANGVRKQHDRRSDVGVHSERLTNNSFQDKPCLFLDRDGVIVEDTHYLHRVADIEFIPGLAEAIAQTNLTGIPVVIVTNQAGIGRGYYDWNAFARVQKAILKHLGEKGATIDMVLACAYHTDAEGSLAVADHPWRKPRPGMLLEAARELEIDLSQSFIIGDSISDLLAGKAAGLCGGALVMTGHGRREFAEKSQPVFGEWRSGKSFQPQLAETAGDAIREWLLSIGADRNVN